MFEKLYKVRGVDVNGFMVMQNVAYVTYATKLIEVFLTEKGYSKNRLNKLKIGLQKRSEQIFCTKPLMFNQFFTVALTVDDFLNNGDILKVSVIFYNEQKEESAKVTTEFYWFDYKKWTPTLAPKNITRHFTQQFFY